MTVYFCRFSPASWGAKSVSVQPATNTLKRTLSTEVFNLYISSSICSLARWGCCHKAFNRLKLGNKRFTYNYCLKLDKTFHKLYKFQNFLVRAYSPLQNFIMEIETYVQQALTFYLNRNYLNMITVPHERTYALCFCCTIVIVVLTYMIHVKNSIDERWPLKHRRFLQTKYSMLYKFILELWGKS